MQAIANRGHLIKAREYKKLSEEFVLKGLLINNKYNQKIKLKINHFWFNHTQSFLVYDRYKKVRPINRTVISAIPRKNINSRGKLISSAFLNFKSAVFIIKKILLAPKALYYWKKCEVIYKISFTNRCMAMIFFIIK
jgi:hypothetical protein